MKELLAIAVLALMATSCSSNSDYDSRMDSAVQAAAKLDGTFLTPGNRATILNKDGFAGIDVVALFIGFSDNMKQCEKTARMFNKDGRFYCSFAADNR
jgi:hypothetical protein